MSLVFFELERLVHFDLSGIAMATNNIIIILIYIYMHPSIPSCIVYSYSSLPGASVETPCAIFGCEKGSRFSGDFSN